MDMNKPAEMPCQNKRFNDVLDVFLSVAKALIIIFILLTFVLRVCTVVGSSMDNTLHNGEKLLLINGHFSIKENDIIVFHQTGYINEPVVKRVIATGNKYVKIDYDNCITYVSDDAIFDKSDIIDESGYAYFDTGSYKMKGTLEIYVPQGYLFVLGDNRNNSTDSRSDLIGLVDERTVLGKVIFRFSPADKIGFIK